MPQGYPTLAASRSHVADVALQAPGVVVTVAHGSGVDDLLWFVVPVLVAIGVLRVVERRARQKREGASTPNNPSTGPDDSDQKVT